MRSGEVDVRRATEGEVCLDAGQSARVSVSVPSRARFDRPLLAPGAICRCPDRSKVRSRPRNRWGSGECRLITLFAALLLMGGIGVACAPQFPVTVTVTPPAASVINGINLSNGTSFTIPANAESTIDTLSVTCSSGPCTGATFTLVPAASAAAAISAWSVASSRRADGSPCAYRLKKP